MRFADKSIEMVLSLESEHSRSRGIRDQKGQSLLEFALTLPLLLGIVFGLAEFGRAYFQYNTLNKSIRNAARFLSANPYTDANISGARNMAVYGNTSGTSNPLLDGLTTSMVTVTPGGGTAPYTALNPPRWVTVRASYPFSPLVPNLIKLNNTNLSPRVMLRYVGPNAAF